MKVTATIRNRINKVTRRLSQFHRLSKSNTATNTKKPLSSGDLTHLMGMDYARFSQLLPYRYFDTDDKLFINTQSIGFALEVAPLNGANEEVIHSIAELIKNKLDPSICMQVMLFGSNQIDSIIGRQLAVARDADPTFEQLARSQYDYLKHAALHGFHNKRQLTLPLRDYRCFVFVSKRSGYDKAGATKLADLRDEVITELRNTGLANVELNAIEFVRLLKSLINIKSDEIKPDQVKLDKYKELHEQVVDPSFNLTVYPHHLATQISSGADTEIVALSLQELPDVATLWSQADNFANILKPNLGIPCPFVISVHFKCEPQEKSKLKALRKASSYERKANSSYAKLIPGTTQAAADWKKIREDLAAESIQLCKIYYNCVLFTNANARREHVSQAIAAFRVNGLDLYNIKYQQFQSYLALLPFTVEQGLWHDLQLLGRLNTMTTWNLTNLLPLVADYKGTQNGQGVLAPTFRHQAAFIDNFDLARDNYNVCVTATSGSGKSVLSQSMIAAVLADGGKVWVIDLGQSYKKFCETLGGTYLDVANLKLNPFSAVTDITQVAESIRDLIAVMASPNEGLSDVQKAYLLDAVTAAYEKRKQQATMDDIIDYLQSIDQSKAVDLRINDIATLLKKFSKAVTTKESIAARIFNAAPAIDATNSNRERFMVLELGELENQPDLLKAILFALILQIEEKMYHSEKNRKKLCVIDEAWRLLSGSNRTAAAFIEKGFRTARKHRGAFMTITQSINDFYASAEAMAAWACAENKIIMRQNEKAFKDFIHDQPDYFSEYEQTLIQSFRGSAQNGFSEMMVQQGNVSSFHRLFLDPFQRVMYSSRADEHQAIQKMMDDGLSAAEAIAKLANQLYADEISAIERLR